MDHLSHSVAETEAIAADFSSRVRGGECICLYGDLGAGKTQFVRGIVRGLGGNPRAVSSPTFVLLNVYSGGRLTVYHLDAYRARGPEDFEGIGFGELLGQPDAIVVVEWPQRVTAALPATRIDVRLEHLGGEMRQITLP